MTFALDISAFVAKTKGNANIVVRKVVGEVAASVVTRSPVDTGRFRANWQYAEGEYSPLTTADVDPSGGDTVGRIQGAVAVDAAGKMHYVTNSLPYADRLENGWSKQSPFGMVGLTVVEYQQYVDKAVASLS